MGKGTQIGWYNVKTDMDYINNGFECAAWFEKIHIKAGKYPIVVYAIDFDTEGKMHSSIDSGYICYEGEIICDDFQSRFCGTPIGSYDGNQNKGKKTEASESVYLYSLAHSILEGSIMYELFPEYEAREINFTSIFDGRQLTTWGIFKKDNSID